MVTYKQADEDLLLGVVHGALVGVLLSGLGERLQGGVQRGSEVLVVGLVVEAAVEAAGGLQPVEAVLHVTGVAAGDTERRETQRGDTERRETQRGGSAA